MSHGKRPTDDIGGRLVRGCMLPTLLDAGADRISQSYIQTWKRIARRSITAANLLLVVRVQTSSLPGRLGNSVTRCFPQMLSSRKAGGENKDITDTANHLAEITSHAIDIEKTGQEAHQNLWASNPTRALTQSHRDDLSLSIEKMTAGTGNITTAHPTTMHILKSTAAQEIARQSRLQKCRVTTVVQMTNIREVLGGHQM